MAAATTPAVATPETESAQAGHIVGRGMLALVFSQLITTPVSMVVQALIARRLGATPFGAIYFATAALGVWYLFVEWGGHAQVAAEVARDRQAGARLFASGMLLRIAFALVVIVVIPPFGRWMGYDESIRLSLTLVSLKLALQALGALCLAVIRGFEKVQWQAGTQVFGNLTEATLVVLTLLGGGGLRDVLMAQVAAAALTVAVQVGLVARLGVAFARPDWLTAINILKGGFSFMILDVVVRLQPYVDATFLSRLAPADALGWHSAASRISGVLIFPALTLNYALYPTLARLWISNRETYASLVRLGLRVVAILGLLAGVGTALFAPWAVSWIYGNEHFAPAGASLSVMSVFIMLVYSSIVLGPSIAAAGRQWWWCGAQSLCIVVSVLLDPILIPYAQRTWGNGSLGVSLSIGIAEIAMVSCGLMILPRGVVNGVLGRTFLRCLVSAAAAGVAGLALRGFVPLAIPATVVVYFATLRMMDELEPELLMLAPPWLADLMRPLMSPARP